MADGKATSTFMNLPLEVRHTIFELAAARHVKPKKLLRYWFEKKEVKALIAEIAANNPDRPTPQPGNGYNGHDSDSDILDEAEEEGEEGQDHDSDEEDNQENAGEENGQDEEADDVYMVHDEQDHDEEVTEDQSHSSTGPQSQSTPLGQTEHEPGKASLQNNTDQIESEVAEVENGVETQDPDTTVDQDGDEAMTEEQGDENDITLVTRPLRCPTHTVYPHQKWRHIPKFMRLTHCPPPVELLLTSKQLNDEVKDWYYDVAVLRIEATGSFAHTSFFEEAFSQITEAAFSPMENIRKVEVTFVWDTTWIRSDTTGCVEAIFPALLRQRSSFVHQILTQAPDLKELVIHWHDSAQDSESASLRADVLEPFDSLPATIKIVEHYIAVDAKPHEHSIAGKRRVEFQSILDAGLDRLF